MTVPDIARHQADLHDAFFEERDQDLKEFLEFEANALECLEPDKMRERAGIRDSEVLDDLRRVGINSSTMTAFMLLPLIRLAWADSKVQDGEFEYILQAAADDGIDHGSPAYRLLNRWLEQRPTDRMLTAWRNYALALARELDRKSLEVIRQATFDRLRRVAQASGGILGFGEKVSENERRVLKDLDSALTPIE
jgi:hypothetical protein